MATPINTAVKTAKTSLTFQEVRGNESKFNIASILTNEGLATAYAERRSTISFLISAIALAGFRPLGQVRVQFMMVWQR